MKQATRQRFAGESGELEASVVADDRSEEAFGRVSEEARPLSSVPEVRGDRSSLGRMCAPNGNPPMQRRC